MQYFLVNKKLERKRSIPYSIHVKIVRLGFLMFIFSLNILIAQANNQLITLKFQKAKLNRVLDEISNQTNFQFFYNDQINQVTGPITIELSGATITQVLDRILPKNKLEYQITESQITINLKNTNRSISNVQIQEYIEGTVKDINGEPLIGASIKIKGSHISTSSTTSGTFRILSKPTDILLVSYMGYKSQEVSLVGKKIIAITMYKEDQMLEEVDVVATGYQTIDRRKFTGAATKIKAEDAQRFGVPDVSRMLEGQVSGVSVQNVSGTFGAAPKIRVRGATSITGDNKPLWVVDGIILEDVINISNDQLSTGDASTLLGSSVAGINPDDIESFEILKDAAATSLLEQER